MSNGIGEPKTTHTLRASAPLLIPQTLKPASSPHTNFSGALAWPLRTHQPTFTYPEAKLGVSH